VVALGLALITLCLTLATPGTSAAPAVLAPTPQSAAATPPPAAPNPSPSSLAELGRSIFDDPSLSEPAGTACASCHAADHAYSSYNGSERGVPRGSRSTHFARRNAPSLLYLKHVPPFGYRLDDDDSTQPAPYGGFFWDGRSDSIARLVRQPLLNPDEMNNHDSLGLAHKLERASYAASFRHECGPVFASPEQTVACLGRALEAYLTAPEMAPFSSRFDAYVRGRGKLTPYEMQGMRLFKDPVKGACAGCHRFNETAREPALSLFTDYG